MAKLIIHCLVCATIALALIAQHAASLVPEPRVNDGPKFTLQNSITKQDGQNEQLKKKFGSESNATLAKGADKNKGDLNRDDNGHDDDDDDDDYELRRPKFLIGEPYKSLFQSTTRFAIAQTNLINYVQIDTAMDLINDTGYMLASPYIMRKAIRVTAIALATLMTVMFFVPSSIWKALGSKWRSTRGRLLEIERYLPNGINEMGIINMLEQQTEEFLARVELNNEACRQQSICQAGELLRCSFPKGTKSIVNFISENFSRPRYRDHQYIGSFLKGFVDRNCAANTEMDQSRSCLSSTIKSLSSCSRVSNPLFTQPPPAASKPEAEKYQTLQAARA